jgi:hypothetical protein
VSISTYSELKTSIADWVVRTDLTSVIPDFITLAEAQMNREVRDRRMIKRATAAIDAGYTAVPTLEFVTPDQAAEEQRLDSSNGRPQFFTMIGEEFQVVPSPDSSYTGELTYYEKIQSLSDSNTSNWMLENHPDIYLYGSLMQAAPYLDDDERIPTWGGLYSRAIESLNVSDQRARIGSSSIRMRAKAMG